MTTQRKIFGAVLTLAMSAFGIDRLWPSGGAGPGVTPRAALEPRAKSPPRSAASPDAARQAASRALAARLAAVARADELNADEAEDASYIPDAFKPSSHWYPTAAATPAAVAASAPVAPERLAEFRAHHRLTAVMRSPHGGMAIIGGKVYVPGQTVGDGFKLASIKGQTAEVTRDGVSLLLAIDQPGALTSLSPEP